MSVLGREQDSYQRALEAYQRQINSYNRGVDKYRATLVKDNNGNLLVVSTGWGQYLPTAVDSGGQLVAPALPQGFDIHAYGATPIPGGGGFHQLRQNPTEAKRQTLTGLRKFSDEGGEVYYDSNGNYVDVRGWRYDGMTPGQGTWDSEGVPTYNFSRDASTYMDAPAEWKKEFNRKAPSATPAQAAKIGAPSLAEVESGLIGEVMKGKGVRYGGPVYRPRGDA